MRSRSPLYRQCLFTDTRLFTLSIPVEGRLKQHRRPDHLQWQKHRLQAAHLSVLPHSPPSCSYILMCFQSKPHPHLKQNRCLPQWTDTSKSYSTDCQQWLHCSAEPSSSTAAVSRHRPNKTAGLCENETQTPNKTTGRRGEGETGARTRQRGKIKCQLWSCHGSDKKTIISGIWVNNSSLAVKLSLSKCKCC